MSMVEQRPPDVTVVDRGESPGPPRSRATRTLGVMASLVVLAIIVVVGLQIFQGCWIDVGNELDHQPSVGYVTPPRGSVAASAIPIQGGDLLETTADTEQASAAGLTESAGDPTNPVPPSSQSTARGLALYPVYCFLCHGEPGANAPGPVGQTFIADALPPDLKAMAATMTAGQVYILITEGTDVMPPLASLLAKSERWDVVNYLRSLTPGLQPPAPSDARLNAVLVFAGQCAGCHGATGQGALGPALYPSTFLAQATPAQIAAMIKAGRQGYGMPAFVNQLGDDDLSDLVTMLQDLQREGPTLIQQALVQLRLTTTTAATTATSTSTTVTTAPGGTTTTTLGGSTTTGGPTTTGVSPPTTGSNPALIAQGQLVFNTNCQPCHGVNGVGGICPKLQPNAIVSSSPDSVVRSIIENGKPGTAMPAWKGRLAPADITAVLALVRSWQGGKVGATVTGGGSGVQLPFNHSVHIALKVECLFCHATARRGPPADILALQICAMCHQDVAAPTPKMKEVIAAYDASANVSWPRLYRVRDFVYFAHRDHVVTGKVECARCHGDVAAMSLAVKAVDVDNMGFCLSCHTGKTVNGKQMTDCDICHK